MHGAGSNYPQRDGLPYITQQANAHFCRYLNNRGEREREGARFSPIRRKEGGRKRVDGMEGIDVHTQEGGQNAAIAPDSPEYLNHSHVC